MEIKNNEVKITTQITYDIYKKSCRFALFKGRLYKKGPFLIYIIGLITMLSSLYSGYSYGFETMDIITIFFFAIIMIVITYLLFIAPKGYYKSAKLNLGAIIKFNFSEEYMIEESTSELANGCSKIKYSALHRVYEIDDMILILISKSQVYIIPKKDCSSQNIIDIRRILQSKVEKYRNYSKKH